MGIRLDDCQDYEYLLNGDTQCRTCSPCPAGQMYAIHCGYQQDVYGNITKPGKECDSCPSNQFKSGKSLSLCRYCKVRCPSNRAVVYPCNNTHNLQCSQCENGYYTEYDGNCMPCMPCYGDALDPEFQKQFVKQECRRAGMGMKSCRVLRTGKPSIKPITTNCKKGSLKKTKKWKRVRHCRCRRRNKCKKRCLSFSKKTRHRQRPKAIAAKPLSLRQLSRLLSKHQRNVLIFLLKLNTDKRK